MNSVNLRATNSEQRGLENKPIVEIKWSTKALHQAKGRQEKREKEAKNR